MINNKICSVCGISKFIDEFHDDKRNKGSKRTICKKCISKRSKKYYQEHKERINNYGRKYKKEHKKEASEQNKKWYERTGRQQKGSKSMYEDKTTHQYLGIVIAERLVRHLFNDVEVMPMHNPGFDFICNKGKKIDVKSCCTSKGKYPHWAFNIDYNKTADFFICVAFDNIETLNPIYLWMIPGKELNKNSGKAIYPSTIHKWDEWKMDINDAQICCAELKNK